MALSKNQFTSSVHVILDSNSAFVSAYRVQAVQIIDSTDGSVVAERARDDQLTLAQLKTIVAAL